MTNEREAKLVEAHKHGLANARAGVIRAVIADLAADLYADEEARSVFLAGYHAERHRLAFNIA